MVRDIRDLASDPEAYAAKLRRRWGGLLSYRYIGRRHASMNVGPADDTVTVRHDMRNAARGLLLSVFGIASPEGGLVTDMEAVPNPVVHSCQVLDPGQGVKRFEVLTEDLKRGRQMSYSRSRIVDADRSERVLALTEGQGVSIGTPPPGLQRMEVDPVEVVDAPDMPPLWQVFGGKRRSDGAWTLPEFTVEVASPDAALHIGPQFVILEAAAIDRAATSTGSNRLQGRSSHVMFLARGKYGPFRFVSEVMQGAGRTVGVRTLRYDDGADSKLITASSHVFEVDD